MDPTARFTELVDAAASSDAAVPLDQAALLIAAHARPDLDLDAELHRLDALASAVLEPTLDGLLRHVYRDEGFTGAVDDYYNPQNSFIDRVIERRTGIPITLSLVTIEIGRRIGVPLAPIGMPGHFLIGDRVLDGVYVDCFAGGRVLSTNGCEQLFRQLHGEQVPWSADHLVEVTSMAVVQRVLVNLRAIYSNGRDTNNLLWVLTLLTLLPGSAPQLDVELAHLLTTAGRYHEAADRYEVAAAAAAGPEADQYRSRAQQLSAYLN